MVASEYWRPFSLYMPVHLLLVTLVSSISRVAGEENKYIGEFVNSIHQISPQASLCCPDLPCSFQITIRGFSLRSAGLGTSALRSGMPVSQRAGVPLSLSYGVAGSRRRRAGYCVITPPSRHFRLRVPRMTYSFPLATALMAERTSRVILLLTRISTQVK